MSLRASLSEKEDISLGGFSDIFSKPRKGALLQYTTSSDSSGLSFEVTCEGRENWSLISKPHQTAPATDLRRILLRCVLDAVCRFIIRAGGETGTAAILSQLSQVRNVLLPFYQDATPQCLKPSLFGKSETKRAGEELRERRSGSVHGTSGEGRSFSGSEGRGLVRSLLPRMLRRFLAITACCSTEQ